MLRITDNIKIDCTWEEAKIVYVAFYLNNGNNIFSRVNSSFKLKGE